MLKKSLKKVLIFFLSLVVIFSVQGVAFAYDNPDLLPKEQTPIIDLAKALSDKQRADLEKSLISYEEETGWKIRVLSQYEKTPGLAVKDYWNLDETSLLIIADPRGGNLLSFNVGDAYFALMPRIFWVELQTRFGNQFYVRDNGEDGAILESIKAIETCLDRGGCEVVPGLPQEQWQWTLLTSLLGGTIAGFAASPREGNKVISIGWLMLLSPLWIMLFGIFGIAPVITRTNDLLPLLRNILGFIGSAVGAYLIAERKFKDPELDNQN
tara:strand:- start:286 stop:1089 length:804 start_codon:yes stop_codon:yes gene_type:complete